MTRRGKRRAREPGPAGFTLVELLVTLVLLSVVGAVAVPAFRGERTPPELDDAAGRVEALFRMARDSAISAAVPVTVVVDSVTGGVWIDARPRVDPVVTADPQPDGATAGEAGGISLRGSGSLGGGPRPGGDPQGTAGAPGTRIAGEPLGLPGSVTLELPRARSTFRFDPGGTAIGDPVVLRASTGEVRIITLDPWTGHVVSH